MIAFFFLYIGTAFTSPPLSATEQMFYWALLAMLLFWKFWDIIERGEEYRKEPIIDSNIYFIWQNLRETCWNKAGHFFDLPDFLSWKATGVTARYVNYKLGFICVHPFLGVCIYIVFLTHFD